MIGRFVCQLASDSRLGRLHWSGCTEDLDLVGLSGLVGCNGSGFGGSVRLQWEKVCQAWWVAFGGFGGSVRLK